MAGTDNLKPFKPGESGNPNGRPKKLVSVVLDDLHAAGYQNITRTQIVDVYETVLALSEDDLKTLLNDKNIPMIYRIVVKAVLSAKGFEVVERMLDRTHGKANQPITIDPNEAELNDIIRNLTNDRANLPDDRSTAEATPAEQSPSIS